MDIIRRLFFVLCVILSCIAIMLGLILSVLMWLPLYVYNGKNTFKIWDNYADIIARRLNQIEPN